MIAQSGCGISHCLNLCWLARFICDPINSIKYVVFIDYKHLLCVCVCARALSKTHERLYFQPIDLSRRFKCEPRHWYMSISLPVCTVYECLCLQMSYQPNAVVCCYVRKWKFMWQMGTATTTIHGIRDDIAGAKAHLNEWRKKLKWK